MDVIVNAARLIYANYSTQEAEDLLRQTYLSALTLAVEHQLEPIVFPLITSGIYGYPKEKRKHFGWKLKPLIYF